MHHHNPHPPSPIYESPDLSYEISSNIPESPEISLKTRSRPLPGRGDVSSSLRRYFACSLMTRALSLLPYDSEPRRDVSPPNAKRHLVWSRKMHLGSKSHLPLGGCTPNAAWLMNHLCQNAFTLQHNERIYFSACCFLTIAGSSTSTTNKRCGDSSPITSGTTTLTTVHTALRYVRAIQHPSTTNQVFCASSMGHAGCFCSVFVDISGAKEGPDHPDARLAILAAASVPRDPCDPEVRRDYRTLA